MLVADICGVHLFHYNYFKVIRQVICVFVYDTPIGYVGSSAERYY